MIHRDLRGELQAYNFHISFAHWSSTWYKHSYSTWEWGFGWSLTALSLAAAGNEVRVYAISREIITSCLWRCNHRPKASCVHASMRYAYRRAHSVELFINRSREEGRRRWVLDVRQPDTRASMLRTEVVHWGGTRGLQVPQSWGDPLQWSFNLGTPHPHATGFICLATGGGAVCSHGRLQWSINEDDVCSVLPPRCLMRRMWNPSQISGSLSSAPASH